MIWLVIGVRVVLWVMIKMVDFCFLFMFWRICIMVWLVLKFSVLVGLLLDGKVLVLFIIYMYVIF